VVALLGESAAPISSVPLIHEVGACHAFSAGRRTGLLASETTRRAG
jgi:hypothetical protein